ncbi:MAG: DegT/DnrJ/EryC1/StrS family aminotransferase [Deltaproteobacteria bacterium]|nr:DegT/DnrJ/EryC1/StrS family aminotransferase [Deltaproteobacteria bacterium]
MSVPLLDLKPQYNALQSDFDAAVARVIGSQRFIMGPEVTGFEDEVGQYLGAEHAIGCASGSDALLLALWALDIGPGDEVITTAFTFFATAGAVSRLGATPVFVDIEPGTFNIDPAAIEAAITPRTKAIIPVHIFGLPADMGAINSIAKRHGLRVIEDAAQSIGATLHGAQTGTMGDFGCFSFFPSKNLGCWGDGGLVTSMQTDIAEVVRQLRVHGNYPKKYYHARVGMNSRLDALQAAILRVKLPHLDSWGAARRERVAGYKARLADAGIADQVVFQTVPDGSVPVYHQCVVRVPRRDDLLAHLRERNIGCAVYYPRPLHLQECFSDLGQGEGALPITEQACLEVLALPIFPELTSDHQDQVVAALKDFLG